jgi:exosome complex component CSL4
MDGNVRMIGDYLGTIEEFVPGEGTYTEDGKIYAAVIGESSVDKDRHSVSVSVKPLGEPRVGQVVYAEVVGFRKNVVSVSVSRIEGYGMNVNFRADIYVSNISDKYVEKPESLFGIGDIVKARIIKMEADGTIDLSTKEEFGVVKAFCKVCRRELFKAGKYPDSFECESCGNQDKRKIAKDYGNVVL